MSDAVIEWQEDGQTRAARWHSEAGVAAPRRVVLADDRITADQAWRLACEGTALLWRGDFPNARQLLTALARRVDRSRKPPPAEKTPLEAFHLYRMGQAQRARTLGMVLIQFERDHVLALSRAPDVAAAAGEAYGPVESGYVTSLRELLGLIGAHEWRKKGVEVPALGAAARIHPHYGVFSPVRGEYLALVASTPLPKTGLAFDIGTGTGVLAAVLARRGIERVVATEHEARALACASENIAQLGLNGRVDVLKADLYPPPDAGRAGLIVCNPPWLPGKPGSPFEQAIYDPESRMLKRYLAGLAAHLAPDGEGWLILSDLAEHLGLRTRIELQGWIDAAGLEVLGRSDARPQHPKASDASDPLHAARKAEVTSLWRLAAR